MTQLNYIPCRVLALRSDGTVETFAAEIFSVGPKFCWVRLCEDVMNLRSGSKIKGQEIKVPRAVVLDRNGRPW